MPSGGKPSCKMAALLAVVHWRQPEGRDAADARLTTVAFKQPIRQIAGRPAAHAMGQHARGTATQLV